MDFYKKHSFSMTERQIGKPGKVHRRDILRSSYMKFYQIWSGLSRNCFGWTEGRNGRIGEATTICSIFGKHKNVEMTVDEMALPEVVFGTGLSKTFGETKNTFYTTHTLSTV